MLNWTGRSLEWMLDHGIYTDAEGRMQIKKSKWDKLIYTDRSLKDPEVRTLGIPTDFGMALLFENKHFCIING